MEGYRAFNRHASILAYELPWNATNFEPGYFIRVTEEDLKRKIEALESYESQKLLGRGYIPPRYLEAQLVFRGAQCGCSYAEAFEVIRMVH